MQTLHASGLHSTSNADVRTQVAAWIERFAPDYLTHTEAGPHRSALTLHDGYGVIHPRGDDGDEPENAIQYRVDGPALLSSKAARLSSLPIPRRGGKFCFVTYGEFADHHHIAGHMPSGVEDDLREGRRGPQVDVYRDAIEGLKRFVATLDGPCIISMDFNLDLTKPWVGEFLRRHFPDFTPTAVPATEPGTHGTRLIDFSLVRGYTSVGDVIGNPASDHRAIRETHRPVIQEAPVTTVIDHLRAAGVECYTRREWGSPREADGSYARRRRTHPMPPGPAAYHFLHITVTGDTDLPADGKEAARDVESFGLSTPPMVSYQDLVTNEGRYFQGQDYGTKGTHTVNDKNVPGFPDDLNLHGYAAAIMQNVGDQVTDDQVRVLAMVYAARELAGLVRRGAPIFPHLKFANKACPGSNAMARLDEIRRLKDRFVRDGLPRPTQEDEVTPEDIDAIATAAVAKLLGTKIDTETGEWTIKQLLRGTYNNVVGE